MQATYKTCTMTRARAVSNASAKSASGVSLNDFLLVGLTVHPSDVLLIFRFHRIAVSMDVSKMYQITELVDADHDLHIG